MEEQIITKEYLRANPHHIFVFGDNLERKGISGAAALRNEINTYGFITKKTSANDAKAFYKLDEYEQVFYNEIRKLTNIIKQNTDNIYLISALGAGLANKHHIFELVIEPKIRTLLVDYKNVKFLWSEKKEDALLLYWGYITKNFDIVVKKYFNDYDLDASQANNQIRNVIRPFVVESEEAAFNHIKELYATVESTNKR